jgi:hypothetical protein
MGIFRLDHGRGAHNPLANSQGKAKSIPGPRSDLPVKCPRTRRSLKPRSMDGREAASSITPALPGGPTRHVHCNAPDHSLGGRGLFRVW